MSVLFRRKVLRELLLFFHLETKKDERRRRRRTTRIECSGFYASQIPTFCVCNLTRDHGIVDIKSFPDAKIPFLRTRALKNRFPLSLRSTQ